MYATHQDMLDRFGEPRLIQLTDINEPLTGGVVSAVLDAALTDASGEIDGYLVGRMAVPLVSPPAVLKTYCCSIAHYRLVGGAADEVTRADYKAAIAFLTRVASGEIPLMPPADMPAQGGLGPVLFDAGSKVMGRERSDDCERSWRGF